MKKQLATFPSSTHCQPSTHSFSSDNTDSATPLIACETHTVPPRPTKQELCLTQPDVQEGGTWCEGPIDAACGFNLYIWWLFYLSLYLSGLSISLSIWAIFLSILAIYLSWLSVYLGYLSWLSIYLSIYVWSFYFSIYVCGVSF